MLAEINSVYLHDLRPGVGQLARAAQDSDGGGRLRRAKVDLDDTVLIERHDRCHQAFKYRQFASREIAEKHGVLKPFSMIFHDRADSAKSLRTGNIICDEIPTTCHGRITW